MNGHVIRLVRWDSPLTLSLPFVPALLGPASLPPKQLFHPSPLPIPVNLVQAFPPPRPGLDYYGDLRLNPVPPGYTPRILFPHCTRSALRNINLVLPHPLLKTFHQLPIASVVKFTCFKRSSQGSSWSGLCPAAAWPSHTPLLQLSWTTCSSDNSFIPPCLCTRCPLCLYWPSRFHWYLRNSYFFKTQLDTTFRRKCSCVPQSDLEVLAPIMHQW